MPPLSIQIRNATYSESNGTFGIIVTLSGNPAAPVTVDWTTANGTALAGQDYTFASGTITFNPGGSQIALIQITVNNDMTPEPPETFLVNLTNPTNAVFENNQSVVTILDND